MASNLSPAAIREYARRVADHHGGYDERGWISPRDLVVRIGGTIRVGTPGQDKLTVRAEGTFELVLPAATSPRRRRFTTARGLGRYVLHWRYPQLAAAAVFTPGVDERADVEANVFAAALLMPADHFATAHARLLADPWALARRFGVSPLAAETMTQVLELPSPTAAGGGASLAR